MGEGAPFHDHNSTNMCLVFLLAVTTYTPPHYGPSLLSYGMAIHVSLDTKSPTLKFLDLTRPLKYYCLPFVEGHLFFNFGSSFVQQI